MRFVQYYRYINLSRCSPLDLEWTDPVKGARLLCNKRSKGHPAICLSVVTVHRASFIEGEDSTLRGSDKTSYRRVLHASPYAIEGERMAGVLGAALDSRLLLTTGGLYRDEDDELAGYLSFTTKPGGIKFPLVVALLHSYISFRSIFSCL